uniref:Uncharacterized protein n=1 Tax=Nelumbo nucifera TaxID=4432 RepID=A0A822ZKV5_NELNU|nr:TPA_asm: hypothetical protein HUJ06_001856 [Nelumbo nucifera]
MKTQSEPMNFIVNLLPDIIRKRESIYLQNGGSLPYPKL